MSDITIYNQTYAITNKDLQKNVSAMVKANEGIKKDLWKYAIASYNIVSQELYKEDFKSLTKFAKALDVNVSVLSKYANAVACMLETLEPLGYTMENMSVGKAYLLSTIEDINDFIKWTKNAKLELLTTIQLEELIKNYKKRFDEVVESESVTDESESVTDESESVNDENIKALIQDEMLYISINSKVYAIPLNELEEYRV